MRNNIWDQKKNDVDSYGKIIDILLRKKIYREKLLKERTTQTERSVDQLEKEKKLRTLHKRSLFEPKIEFPYQCNINIGI